MTVRMALFKSALPGRVTCNDFIFIDSVHQDHQSADGRIKFVSLRNILGDLFNGRVSLALQVFVLLVKIRRGDIVHNRNEPLLDQLPDAV